MEELCNNHKEQAPLLILDVGVRVKAANLLYYQTFRECSSHINGYSLFEIDGGAWDILPLRLAFDEMFNKGSHNQNIVFVTQFSSLGKRMTSVSVKTLKDQTSEQVFFILRINQLSPF